MPPLARITFAGLVLCLAAFAAERPDRRKSLAAVQRAQRLEASGRAEEALEACSEAIRLDPGNAQAWGGRGKLHLAAE